MKRVMFVALALLLVGAAAFAVDFSASVNMSADLWGTNGFNMGSPGQSDADLLVFSVSTDMAGANAQIRTGNSGDDTTANVRNLAVWFKPVSMLKITVGNTGSGLFTEQLNWWHVPTGASGGSSWDSAAGIQGKGVQIDLTPVAGLTISGGIAPGFGNAWMIDTDPATTGTQLGLGPNTKWGMIAKYAIQGIGTAGAGYRFDGAFQTAADGTYTGKTQSFRVGMDFTMVPGLYAFVTGIFRIDQGYSALSAATIDNYVAYSAGAFTVKAEFPVTIRLTGVATDHNYMSYDVKASYKVLDNFSPYLRLTQDSGLTANYGRSLDLTSDLKFAPTIQLGADYSFGKASLGTAIKINLPALDAGETTTDVPVTWSIPFTARVSW